MHPELAIYKKIGKEKFWLKDFDVIKKEDDDKTKEEKEKERSAILEKKGFLAGEDFIKLVSLGLFDNDSDLNNFLRSVEPFKKYIINYFNKKNSIEKIHILNPAFEEKVSVFGNEKSEDFLMTLREIIIKRTSYEIMSSVMHVNFWYSWNVRDFFSSWGFPNGYKSLADEKITQYFSEEIIAKFEEILQTFSDYTFSDIIDNNFLLTIEYFFKDYLKDVSKSINSIENIRYIPALRANTQRIYTYKSQGTDMNELLLKTKYINDFVNKWCRKFGIADKVEIRDIKGVAKEVVLEKNGKEIDLADLGYGVTQLLPIMLKIVSSFDSTLKRIEDVISLKKGKSENIHKINHPNGPILMIEEPETNLHPKLQSMLADLLVDVAKSFEVTLLVETHSEYLIRKLQYLTAKKEITPEDTAIYYLYPPDEVPEGANQVERIKIKENGRLFGNFGTGFFDESANLMMATLTGKNLN